MPTAVIFDFDGVLVDTEPLHFTALRDTLAEAGLRLDWQAYRDRLIGFDDRGVFRAVFADAGRSLDAPDERLLIADKGRRFAEQCRRTPLPPLPGVAELIESLRGPVPLALCSGALPADIEPFLARLGWDDVFSVRVTAADVAASKPDPESYVLAVRRLRERHPDRAIVPARTVAIEDTAAGVAAARGAGLGVVRVGAAAAPAQGGVWPVPDLTQVTRRHLDEVFGP